MLTLICRRRHNRRTAASNMNAKGIQEGKAMSVTGHKTNSMCKRFGIEELDSQLRRARRRDRVIR